MNAKEKMLSALFAFYDKKTDPLAFKMYSAKLERYTEAQVREAMGRATDEETFLPVFATLRKYLDQGKNSELESNARLQAIWVRAQLDAMEKSPDFFDKTTAHIMGRVLPYRDFLGRDQSDLDRFFQAQFVKAYLSAAKNPHEKAEVDATALPEGKSKKRADPKVVAENRAFLGLMEHVNRWRFMRWPTGTEEDEGAEGFFWDKHQKPLSFGDPGMVEKFKALGKNERFLRRHSDWIFDEKAQAKPEISDDLARARLTDAIALLKKSLTISEKA